MNILLLNAGSSSLKATLVESSTGRALASGQADWAGEGSRYRFQGLDGTERLEQVAWSNHAEAVRRVVSDLQQVKPFALSTERPLLAVGHRIVHGGEFTSAVKVTPAVRSRIESLIELAPLHNPPSLNALSAAEQLFPDVPHVAVFDTAFHTTMPPEAYTYPVPNQWTKEWGVRRYGFHGLSHAYCSQRAAELLNRPLGELRLVICHLGHGCSASAVMNGRCVETSMGFTPLDGLMMATRSGSIDPAIVMFVEQRHGLTPEDVDAALNRESGLLGVSGLSADMREILQAASESHEGARLAFAIYTRRVRQTIGSFAVTMGGIDAMIFTAGVGEHSAEVRAAVCQGLECLGIILNTDTNARCKPDADVAAAVSPVRILVIATHEEQTMWQDVRRAIAAD